MQLSIKVVNAKLVEKKLQNIRAAIPLISEDRIKDVIVRIAKQVKNYPSAPAGSRYVRTYKLANSVAMKRTATGYSLKVDPVSKGKHYGRYVIGDAQGGSGINGQAWMHVGRWLLLRDVVDFEMTKLPKSIEDNIALKIRSENMA